MSSSTIQLIALVSGMLSYVVNLYFIFNILRVDYFNPVVKIFVKIFKPLSQLAFFIPNQAILALIIASLLKFFGFYIAYGVDYEIANLLVIALLATLNITLQIILYSIIGAVIISWVAQGNDHPLFRLIEESSFNVLTPIKNFVRFCGC